MWSRVVRVFGAAGSVTSPLACCAQDSNWVGAWWVFFVVAAIMAAVACVPLLLVAPPTPSGAPTRDDGYALHRHGNSVRVRRAPCSHCSCVLPLPPLR